MPGGLQPLHHQEFVLGIDPGQAVEAVQARAPALEGGHGADGGEPQRPAHRQGRRQRIAGEQLHAHAQGAQGGHQGGGLRAQGVVELHQAQERRGLGLGAPRHRQDPESLGGQGGGLGLQGLAVRRAQAAGLDDGVHRALQVAQAHAALQDHGRGQAGGGLEGLE